MPVDTKPCADLSQKKTPICQQLNWVSPANGILGNSDTGWCSSIVASWMLRGKVKIHYRNKELIIAWFETLRDAHTRIRMRVEMDHSSIENSPQWHISLTSYSLVEAMDLHLSRALQHSPAALLWSLRSASKHLRKAEIIFNGPLIRCYLFLSVAERITMSSQAITTWTSAYKMTSAKSKWS